MYWFVAKLLVQIIACLINYVGWKYLASKPLGRQTILDTMIKDHIIVTTWNFISSTLIYIKFTEHYSHEVAMFVVTLNQLSIMAFLLQILVTIVTRYLYIFHPGFMNETSEKNIVITTRYFVGLGALASAFLDDFGKGGPEYTYLTNSVIKEPKDMPSLWLLQVVLVLNLVFLIFTQVRIETFKKQTNPNEPIINLNRQPINRRRRKPKNKHSVVGNKFIAITIALVLIFLMVFLEFAFFPQNANGVAKALRTRVITSIIVHVLVPFLWIRKNKKFRNFFFRMISSEDIQQRPVLGLKDVYKRTNKVTLAPQN